MAPVTERWREEYRPTFDDIEIHLPEDVWENDQSQDIPHYRKRRTAGLWTGLASLAVILAVIAAYGYSVMSSQNARLAWLPGLVKSLSAVRARTSVLEAGLKEWSSKQDSLSTRVQNLDAGWESRLNKVREHAAELVSSTYQKEHQQLDRRTAILNAQIVQMATRQQADHVRVSQLEKQLASTRQELALVRENSTRGLATLQEQQIANQRSISSLNSVLSTDQVDFEARKNIDAEIVPGVSLHLTGMDVAHQRFRGWIWLAGSRRRIWVRHQAIEAPVVFYLAPSGEAYELVVTRVNQKDVAGYMLVPSNSTNQQQDVSSNGTPTLQPRQSAY